MNENENRRGDDFNEIVSMIKKFYEMYGFCEAKVKEECTTNYSCIDDVFNIHRNGNETIITLTFR